MNTGTDWGTNANWNNNLPASHSEYNTTPSASNNALVGVDATIAPGTEVTVKNIFFRDNGTLTLESNSSANASLIHDNEGVKATVRRTFSQPSNNFFHFISSPIIRSVSLNDVFPADQSNIWVRVWDEPNGLWVNQLADDHFMYPGTGYSFYMNIPQTTAIFEGNLNTLNTMVSLSNAGTSGDASRVGWNLIGNPFSSSIDWTSAPMTGITGEVAVWSGAAGNYLYSQGGTGTLPGNIIPPNQAMFVKATSATGIIVNEERVHASQALHKNEVAPPPETLRLDITNNANSYRDAAFIRFHPEATEGIDNKLDAYKLFGETTAPQLFFKNNGTNLSIMALPAIEDKMEIPLHVRTGVNTTYTLSASGIDSFNPAQAIFLKDLLTGTLIDLRHNKEYSFQAIPDPEVPEVRFIVQFFDATVDAADIENTLVRLFSFDKTVCAFTPDIIGATLAITNMLGQRVFQSRVNGAGLHSFETGLSPGLYILSLQTDNIHQSKQIIIK